MTRPSRARSDSRPSSSSGSRAPARGSSRAGASRSSSGSSRRSGPRTRGGAGAPVGIGIAVGIVVVAVVLGFAMLRGGDKEASSGDSAAAKKPASVPAAAPAAPAAAPASLNAGEGKAGKPPRTPAPAIAAGTFQRTEELYAKAQAAYNAGQRARDAGDTSQFHAHVQESRDHLKALYDLLDPYTSWYEEADLEGWAMTAEYVTLRQYLNRYDPLRVKLKKSGPGK